MTVCNNMLVLPGAGNLSAVCSTSGIGSSCPCNPAKGQSRWSMDEWIDKNWRTKVELTINNPMRTHNDLIDLSQRESWSSNAWIDFSIKEKRKMLAEKCFCSMMFCQHIMCVTIWDICKAVGSKVKKNRNQWGPSKLPHQTVSYSTIYGC